MKTAIPAIRYARCELRALCALLFTRVPSTAHLTALEKFILLQGGKLSCDYLAFIIKHPYLYGCTMKKSLIIRFNDDSKSRAGFSPNSVECFSYEVAVRLRIWNEGKFLS